MPRIQPDGPSNALIKDVLSWTVSTLSIILQDQLYEQDDPNTVSTDVWISILKKGKSLSNRLAHEEAQNAEN
jgi:hypothetical protein